MDKKLLIALPIVAVLVLGGGIAAWSFGQNDKVEASHTGKIIGSSNTTATPTVTPKPAVSPAKTTAPSTDDVGTDDTTDDMFDLTPWSSTASAATAAFLTWDTEEPADSRTARLAPLFVPGASALTDVPQPAGEDLFDYEGFTSTVKPTVDYIGFQSQSPDGLTVDMLVMVSYTAHFKSAADSRETMDDANFVATISVKDPKHVIALVQE